MRVRCRRWCVRVRCRRSCVRVKVGSRTMGLVCEGAEVWSGLGLEKIEGFTF